MLSLLYREKAEGQKQWARVCGEGGGVGLVEVQLNNISTSCWLMSSQPASDQ